METIRYLSTSPRLPTNAPDGHPHLVDIDSVDQDYGLPQPGLHVADMVVTVLFNHSPATLDRFLDTSHDFKFHLRYKKDEGQVEFCIVREGNTVTCGYINEAAMRRVGLWDSQHIYRCDDGIPGRWTPVMWKAWPHLQETGEKETLEMGDLSVMQLLAGHVWEVYDAIEAVVEDSGEIV